MRLRHHLHRWLQVKEDDELRIRGVSSKDVQVFLERHFPSVLAAAAGGAL